MEIEEEPEVLIRRKFPKLCVPLRLDDQCLNLLLKQFKRASSQIGRNCKEKKALRVYLSENLPECLLQQILDKAVDKYNVEDALNILDMLQPHRFAKTSVDLIGSNRYEIDCGVSVSCPCSMLHDRYQLDQLYNILLWASPARLQKLSIAISLNYSLGHSNLPNILARAHSLTKLVILDGADNHIIRIVGVNCPSLRFLDVTGSDGITDQGILGLLIKRPSRRTPKPFRTVHLPFLGSTKSALQDSKHFDELVARERNSCANSLESIVLFETYTSPKGIQFICEVLKHSYVFNGMRVFGLKRLSKLNLMEITPVTVEQVMSCTENVISPRLQGFNLEVFKAGDNAKLALCVDNFRAILMMCKIDVGRITSLVLPSSLYLEPNNYSINVVTLGCSFSNLRYFQGGLHYDAIRFRHDSKQNWLPHLQIVNSICSHDSRVVLFMLKYAPALKCLRVNFSFEYEGPDDDLILTDESVKHCLEKKQDHEKNMEEIRIEPSEHLTVETLKSLLRCFPKLERIGNVDWWERITQKDINDFNKYLDANNSQCTVSHADNTFTKQDLKECNNVLDFMNY